MQFSPASFYSIALGSKYSSQHPFLRHLQYSLDVTDQVSNPQKNTDKIIVLPILIVYFFRQQTRRQ
jgi:hypothetical protein